MRIGIDFGGTTIEGIALGPDGRTIALKSIGSIRNDHDAGCHQVRTLMTDLTNEAGRPATRIDIGVHGAPLPQNGLIKNANATWLIGWVLHGDLEILPDLSVSIADDANCLALSEAVVGTDRGHRMVFVVFPGTGLGAGIVVDGQIHTGLDVIAGGWDHNPLPRSRSEEIDGPQWYCRKRGCIETWLAGPGLSARRPDRSGEEISAETIVSDMRGGDQDAEKTFVQYVDPLAGVLAVVVNVLDPDNMVVGGGLSNIHEIYTFLSDHLGAYVFSDICVTPVVEAAHGDASGVRGAAWL